MLPDLVNSFRCRIYISPADSFQPLLPTSVRPRRVAAFEPITYEELFSSGLQPLLVVFNSLQEAAS